ncbi:peptidoglycan-binding lysin domain protein [Fusarium beomiforme]|uniref:Peptidoglycan-binding lysin domain protein n=1 Tax=Fusarium beomiforme TaxID=44412 RepID=A0A9P5A4L0_9HYPO|nr:peptidoglycan-binding lysin domain protein [Fusarium beomiforme]
MRAILFCSAILIGVLAVFVSASTDCKRYVIQDKDICRTIAKASKITYAQLLAWNPGIDVTCGYTYFDNVTDSPNADCWALSNDFILWNPSLVQTDNDEAINSPAVSVAYLYAYLSSATPTLDDGDIEPPSPLADGTVKNCKNYHHVESYNTCQNIMDQYYLNIKQFYSMNLVVKEDCTGLAMGIWYCVSIWPDGDYPLDPADADDADSDFSATSTSEDKSTSAINTASSTPSPIQTGMVSNCDSSYKVQGGDGCWAIAHDKNINLDDFYKWHRHPDSYARWYG